MEEKIVSESDVKLPIVRRVDVSTGGDVAQVDGLKDNLIAEEADELAAFNDCLMTVEMTEVSAAVRRKRRCRRKRKAGEHHRAPLPENAGNDRRRSQRRAWKPYTDMTWEERRAKDELEATRAARRRDRRFASGQAMAPYNTTQFLMEQYDVEARTNETTGGGVRDFQEELEELRAARSRTPESSATGGESTSAAGDENDEDRSVQEELFFLERDFNEAYNRQHVERLEGMTKDELIRDYVQMEATVERLQARLNASTDAAKSGSIAALPASPVLALASRSPAESGLDLRRLREENARLICENELLRRELSAFGSVRTNTNGTLSSPDSQLLAVCKR